MASATPPADRSTGKDWDCKRCTTRHAPDTVCPPRAVWLVALHVRTRNERS